MQSAYGCHLRCWGMYDDYDDYDSMPNLRSRTIDDNCNVVDECCVSAYFIISDIGHRRIKRISHSRCICHRRSVCVRDDAGREDWCNSSRMITVCMVEGPETIKQAWNCECDQSNCALYTMASCMPMVYDIATVWCMLTQSMDDGYRVSMCMVGSRYHRLAFIDRYCWAKM